jgi:hypothetical protein
MGKVRVKAGPVIKSLQSAFSSLITKDKLYVEISEFAVERIKQTARLGKAMVENGDTRKLPDLSPGYVKQRKRLSPGKGGTDAEFFRPDIISSNATFTGQLLKSLSAKILSKGPAIGKIELSFVGSRRDGETNSSVYADLLKRNDGYAFLSLSKKAVERIQNICLTRLRQELIRLKLK